MQKLKAALLAGSAAIVANVLVLAAADFVPLATAHGGLLRLLVRLGLHIPDTSQVQHAFHLIMGLLLALIYALAVEPLLNGSALVKGLIYAAGVWLLNALAVLPLAGEGIAGSRRLGLAGMAWFAAAHALFFVMLALLYPRLGGGGSSGGRRRRG